MRVQCEMEWREIYPDVWVLLVCGAPIGRSIGKAPKGRWIIWLDQVPHNTLEDAQLAVERRIGITRL